MKKPLFNKICIVGVGLIGGSIGLAVKRGKLARFVIGVARHEKTLKRALRKKAMDAGVLNLIEGIQGADLVILCAPVSTIAGQIKTIAPHLKNGAVVIDVGSSKSLIEKETKKYFKKNLFVGCHPMAGSENCGVEHASAGLFKGAVCFMTKPNAKVSQFWKSLGAVPVVMSAQSHDVWAAKASHLPHILAFSLFQDIKTLSPKIPLNPSLGGLARLAQSNRGLWADILLSNHASILNVMSAFEKNFSRIKTALGRKNSLALRKIIANANRHSS